MGNTASNVSVGKPVTTGAIYTAPLGTTLPTSATAALSDDFTCLGYVSEDGLKNNSSPSSTDIKAWGGDTVATAQTEKVDTFQLKLIEALNVDVLKAVYNADNVSGTLASGITVRVNAAEAKPLVWVYQTILNGDYVKRIVVPNGKITQIAEIAYRDSEAIGYDVTITALPGDETFGNDTHKEYIAKAAASGT